jgi:2-polyprenyl-3-methyl-5-hydroxy-6-metoxy-1,4-benzoquinol methylase
MDYDPVKDRLIRIFERSGFGQRLFFAILHLVFLRSWYVRRSLRRLLATRPEARVLDAGTGFGQYTDWILRHFPGVRIVAVDVKAGYLERLKNYLEEAGLDHRAEVRYGDLTDLKESGPFDLILSVDVMEHIEEDRRVFEHFRRVLAPGGALIINTPSDQGGSDVRDSGESSFIGEHVRDGYGVEEITEKLAGAGFRTVAIEFGYGPWGSRAWRLLIQTPMRWLSASSWMIPAVALYYVVALPLGLVLNAVDLASTNPTGTGLTVLARV